VRLLERLKGSRNLWICRDKKAVCDVLCNQQWGLKAPTIECVGLVPASAREQEGMQRAHRAFDRSGCFMKRGTRSGIGGEAELVMSSLGKGKDAECADEMEV
jgi:hypothetical protein